MIRYGSRFVFLYNSKHLRRVWEYKIAKKSTSFPSVIQIQSINDCNGSCSMCPNSQIDKKKVKPMTNRLFKKIIYEILDESKSYPLILLYLQNEPLMDNDIFSKIRFIQSKIGNNIHVGFLTNGSLFDKQNIKKIERMNRFFISISLDALTKETYNKIRNGLDFEHVLNNVNDLLKSKFDKKNVVLEFAVQKNNISELNNFKKFWRYKAGGLLINYLTNRSGDLSNYENLFTPENYYSIIERTRLKIFKHLMDFCPLPFTSFYILNDGDVILCREDWKRKLVLGNVNDNSIKEIWNSEKLNKIREIIYKKRYDEINLCSNCSVWENGFFQVF